MDAEVALFFNRAAGDGDEYNSDGSRAGDPIGPCHSCGFDLMLRKPEGQPPYIACMGHPSCRERVQLPRATQSVSVSQDHCQDCHHGIVHKLDVRYGSADGHIKVSEAAGSTSMGIFLNSQPASMAQHQTNACCASLPALMH